MRGSKRREAGGSDLGVPPYNLRYLTCIVGGLKVMRHVSSRTQQSQAMSFGFPFHETIRVTDFCIPAPFNSVVLSAI